MTWRTVGDLHLGSSVELSSTRAKARVVSVAERAVSKLGDWSLPYLQFHFPGVSGGPDILDGKFRKYPVHGFLIAHRSE